MKLLTTPRMDRCIGCHSCALACARLIHKRLSWSESGIRIHSSGGLSTGYVAVRCLACDTPPCASACPTGALTPRKGGGVVVRKKHCIKCGECVQACPVDGVYQADDGNVYICIHCGRCVEFCPHNCLELQKVHEIGEVLL
ncbi:MAG: 4Fe-4S dicluster domain-containing protein [Desulfobulbaceae bacterium]|nr:MAG: 4Fe-4S dicluster domain-containing protein [Desulfobulbaceae bacterium]